MNIPKKRYLQGLCVIVIVLSIIRCAYPDIAVPRKMANVINDSLAVKDDSDKYDSIAEMSDIDEATQLPQGACNVGKSIFYNADGTIVRNRIYSVQNFGDAFPDQNDLQLIAANMHGVKAVVNRDDAEKRKSELVYVGSSPFYHVDKLKSSIPYLVPRAAELLQDIGRVFYDSLQIKGIPLHKLIVTSVLRSKADIEKLRSHNGNAKENSCHLYGTTFDICYNRYVTVEDPEGPERRRVRNDSLKWVLSEVLNDMRKNNRCLIKYEVKQGCFHITVK